MSMMSSCRLPAPASPSRARAHSHVSDYLRIVYKRRWVAIAAFLLVFISGVVGSVDIVELNPFLDERGRTARTAVELIGSLFGQQITDRPTPSNAIAPGE